MFKRFCAVLASVTLLAACSTSTLTPDTPNTPKGDSGAFKVLATSTAAPSLGSLAAGDYKAVNLAVSRVVFVSGEETTDLAVYSDPVDVDLLSLGSVQAELADAKLPAGSYAGAQLRLVISSASLVVEAADGSDETVDLKVPSGEQSGFKINLNTFEVDPVYGASVVLNFDVNKSVVKTGNGSYNLKPTVKATVQANARVKLVNAVADGVGSADGEPGLSVTANGLALADVAYGAATPYLLVPAGDAQLSVTTAAQGEVNLGEALTLAPKSDTTVVATGLLSAEAAYPLTALVFANGADAPTGGSAQVRIVHAAVGTPPLDVYATAPEAPLLGPLAVGLEYSAATDTRLDLPAGSYRFRATAVGGADTLLDTNGASSELLEGKFYTAVILGNATSGSELSLLVTDAE